MEEQKRLTTLDSDLGLYLGLTPDVLSIEGINLLPSLHICELLLAEPFLVCLYAFSMSIEFI